MKRALLPLAFALIAGFAPRVPAQVPLPKFEARVTDLTGTLTAQQQASLEEKLASFQSRKGSQIAVLMLPSTAPEDIAQFGIRLAEAWKVGRKGTDDGLILIVAKDDRAMRFEVGYGLEGVLPDVLAARIIDDTIAPLFKQGDFYGGINAGLDQAIRVIDGEALPAPDQGWAPSSGFGSRLPLGNWVFFAFIALVGLMRLVPNRLIRAPIAAIIAGGAAWWLIRLLPVAAIVGLLAAIFVTASGSGRSGSRWSSGGGGWGGGGFRGGGGGFGGGGGGSFGGGGASGRW